MLGNEKDRQPVYDDLSLFERRLLREAEKRLPLFAELFTKGQDTAAEEDEPAAMRLRTVATHLLPKENRILSPYPPHISTLSALAGTIQATDRVALIHAYLKDREESGMPLSLFDLLPLQQEAGERIAYIHNPYTDEAYENFAAVLTDPTVLYVEHFREACEAVTAREADYCILPYRNSGNLLPSFAEMAERYSLCLSMLCRVFHTDGTDVTHFALYSRRPIMPETDAKVQLRYSFLCEDQRALGTHLSAAVAMGVTLQELTADPYAASDGALFCTATVCHETNDLLPYVTYLSAFAEGFTCIGLYKEI